MTRWGMLIAITNSDKETASKLIAKRSKQVPAALSQQRTGRSVNVTHKKPRTATELQSEALHAELGIGRQGRKIGNIQASTPHRNKMVVDIMDGIIVHATESMLESTKNMRRNMSFLQHQCIRLLVHKKLSNVFQMFLKRANIPSNEMEARSRSCCKLRARMRSFTNPLTCMRMQARPDSVAGTLLFTPLGCNLFASQFP